MGRQSEQAIAAIAVFRTLEGMVISFFAGFSNAASVLVGTCVGSGELDAAYERAKRLVFLCGSTILCVCLVLLGIHKPLLSAMSLSGESMEIGSHMLMIYCVAAVIRMRIMDSVECQVVGVSTKLLTWMVGTLDSAS